MKNMKMLLVVISSAGTLSTAPAIAQDSPGLIKVDLSKVKNLIAERTDIDAGQIPETVEIDVKVAAEVCKVAADVLGERATTGSGAGACTAEIATPELKRIVLRHVKGIAH